jgi:hypothetical protein
MLWTHELKARWTRGASLSNTLDPIDPLMKTNLNPPHVGCVNIICSNTATVRAAGHPVSLRTTFDFGFDFRDVPEVEHAPVVSSLIYQRLDYSVFQDSDSVRD